MKRRRTNLTFGRCLMFKRPDEVADHLASALADDLIEGQGWYADFRVGTDHVVIFPRRVLRYTMGDQAKRDGAVEYGRSVGVPATRLGCMTGDWFHEPISGRHPMFFVVKG